MNSIFNQGLKASVTQVILPVMDDTTGMVYGYIPITSTTFAGTETGFVLVAADPLANPVVKEMKVNLASVTVPYSGNDGHGFGVAEYMCAIITLAEANRQEYLGYPTFVAASNAGQYSRWTLPSDGYKMQSNPGTIINGLIYGLKVAVAPPVSHSAPGVTAAAMRWVSTIDMSSLQQCAFFDFNWVDLFKASLVDAGGVNPLRIETTLVPVTGEFKAALVTSSGHQVLPLGAVLFNTIRILRLTDVAPGTFVFKFNVVDERGTKTEAVLTLTVV